MKYRRFWLTAVLAAVCSLSGIAQNADGLWIFTKSHPFVRTGMVEGDTIELSRPVTYLPADSYIQFDLTMENAGEKAPLHYMVEVLDGGEWVCDSSFVYKDALSDYSFRTVSSSVRHPSTFLMVYRLSNDVRDSLKVRCRVCSPYATDGSLLAADEPENSVTLKSRGYVGAKLVPLGAGENYPEKRILLIGNSFTYYHGEPFMLQEIAFSQGWILQVNASLKGGQTFRQHCGLEMTGWQCDLPRGYDFAVVQGQSQEPGQFAAAPDSLADVCKAFCELCGRIRATHPSCKVYVESTWAYPAVDNGGFASLEEFDRCLEEGTALIADAAKCDRTLVGAAFRRARAEVPEIDLLDKDSKHQSAAGSYLKACVTWLTISGRDRFEGSVPSCGLDPGNAEALRRIAEETVGSL